MTAIVRFAGIFFMDLLHDGVEARLRLQDRKNILQSRCNKPSRDISVFQIRLGESIGNPAIHSPIFWDEILWHYTDNFVLNPVQDHSSTDHLRIACKKTSPG